MSNKTRNLTKRKLAEGGSQKRPRNFLKIMEGHL